MRLIATPIFYAITISFFVIGLVTGIFFKIMHWHYSNLIVLLGMPLELGLIICMVWEIAASKNASWTKWVWIICYCLIPLISICLCPSYDAVLILQLPVIVVLGILHLAVARKKFAPKY